MSLAQWFVCTNQSFSLFSPLSKVFLAAFLQSKSSIWLFLGWIILPVKWEFRAIRCTTPWRAANTTFPRQKNHRRRLFYPCQLLLASFYPEENCRSKKTWRLNSDMITLMLRLKNAGGKRWCYPSVSPTTFCSISFDGTPPIMIVDDDMLHVIIMRIMTIMMMKTREHCLLLLNTWCIKCKCKSFLSPMFPVHTFI